MRKNRKKFIKKNLNYILMGLAIVLIIISLIFFIVRKNNNSTNIKEKEENNYVVTFDTGNPYDNIVAKIDSEGRIIKPTDPVKEGHLFLDWYVDDIIYDFSKKVDKNITIKAKWYVIPKDEEIYVVKFNSNGGTPVENRVIIKGEVLIEPLEPKRIGYDFLGWYLNNTKFDFNNSTESNITLDAMWIKSNSNNTKFELLTPTLTNVSSNIDKLYECELNIITEGAYSSFDGKVDGYEIYEQKGNKYSLIEKLDNLDTVMLTVDIGSKKTFVSRTYVYGDNHKKIYSGYSNEVIVDNSIIDSPTLSNTTSSSPTNNPMFANLNINTKGFYVDIDKYKSGYEIYEKQDNKYILIKDITNNKDLNITIDVGSKKTFVARVYKYDKKHNKVYSDYSNEVVVDNSSILTPTLTNVNDNIDKDGIISTNLNIISEGVYTDNNITMNGYEIYEKQDNKYILIKDITNNKDLNITIDVGSKKTYVARVYKYDKKHNKVYSDYSNEVVVDNSSILTPTLTIVNSGVNNKNKFANLNINSKGVYANSKERKSGYEIYEKKSDKYILIKDITDDKDLYVNIDENNIKIYVARVYKYNSKHKKIYSKYSNEVIVDNR